MTRDDPLPPPAIGRIARARVDLLARQLPTLAAGSIVLAAGAAWILILQRMDPAAVLPWLAAVTALSAVRYGVYRLYRRAEAPEPRRWALIFCAFSAAAGVAWGALGIFFFEPEAPFTVALVAIILASILASAISSLGAYWPAHLCFGIPCAVPFAVNCFVEGGPTFGTLGALTAFFLVFAESFARSVSRSVTESLELREQNLDLVAELRTAKERAEAADAAKSKLLAVASHDLRQPLHAAGLLSGALESGAAAAGAKQALQGLRRELVSMDELVHRLLDTSMLETGAIQARPREFALDALLESVAATARPVARARGLQFRLAAGAETVWCDPVLLQSIVGNLVANALRYTHEGGVLLAARRRGDSVRVEVWDTGIGIPEEELGRIHRAYYQASNAEPARTGGKGFGLGLSIVHGFAGLLGLRLSVRSRLGRGSVFAVEIPRVR
ncbi:MAG: HAMP domain-containing sensor histidine kinase [Burkholderiaceae bacterium]